MSTGHQTRDDQAAAAIAAITAWARERADVRAVALVGSRARGTARIDSDVDLILLTTDPDQYRSGDGGLASVFDDARLAGERAWGPVRERRLRLPGGLEVELGIATPEWAAVPLDSGTRRVLVAGARILHDPDGLLARAVDDARPPSGLPGVVPSAVTGRGLFDYRYMFDLDVEALAGVSVLDCPAGASPFGAQLRARGGTVTSVDPVYDQDTETIAARVATNLAGARGWLAAHAAHIDWDYLGSPDAYLRACELAADLFTVDYTSHREHYRAAALPDLPFPDGTFDLALSAHLLFAYPQHLDPHDHVAALLELARVTRGEVRVHPVCDPTATRYPHLDHVRAVLAEHDVDTELRSSEKSWIAAGRDTLICRSPTTSPRGWDRARPEREDR